MTAIVEDTDVNSEGHLASIIDNSFDAIISKDLTGTIQTWNASAEAMFGYSRDEAVGSKISLLIPDSHAAEEAAIIRRIKAGEHVPAFETVRKTRDGTLIDVSATVSPIRDGDGRIVGASKIARDITAAKAQERQMRLLMKEVNHRVRNQYGVLLSIIRQTAAGETDVALFEQQLRERVMALALAHDLLCEAEWGPVSLTRLVERQLQSHGLPSSGQQGPDVLLQPNAVLHLTMGLHELIGTRQERMMGTLPSPKLFWRKTKRGGEEEVLEITWKGGNSKSPELQGFTGAMLRRIVPQALSGTAELVEAADGFMWTLRAPLSFLLVPHH